MKNPKKPMEYLQIKQPAQTGDLIIKSLAINKEILYMQGDLIHVKY